MVIEILEDFEQLAFKYFVKHSWIFLLLSKESYTHMTGACPDSCVV